MTIARAPFGSDMSALLDRLKAGDDLRLFLEPDINRDGDQPTVEAYTLPFILIRDQHLWGSTGHYHDSQTLGEMGTDPNAWNPIIASAYAWSSLYPLTCNFSYYRKQARFYWNGAYQHIEFQAHPRYDLLWETGQPFQATRAADACRAGARFKVLIEAENGSIFITNVHTPEIYETNTHGRFYTDLDFFPLILWGDQAMERIVYFLSQVENTREDQDKKGWGKASTPTNDGLDFASLHFILDTAYGCWSRDPSDGQMFNFPVRHAKIFVERLP